MKQMWAQAYVFSMALSLAVCPRLQRNDQFFSVPTNPVERYGAFQECAAGTADRDILRFVNSYTQITQARTSMCLLVVTTYSD
jgi:hypothetical protein